MSNEIGYPNALTYQTCAEHDIAHAFAYLLTRGNANCTEQPLECLSLFLNIDSSG